jgi:hypothetical protein
MDCSLGRHLRDCRLRHSSTSSIQNSKIEWGLTILNRLELAPREVLTVIAVDPQTFEITEVFNTCYPKLTDTEIATDRKARRLVDKLISSDPSDQQRENLQTFDARLKNSLNKIVAESKKFKDGDRRDVLGAIAFDKDRYSDPDAIYRLIIYTDGTIKEAKSQGSLADRYPANFAGAEVSVFGVNGNVQDDELQEKKRTFETFFLKNWAHLLTFSPSLPQQTSRLYPAATRMDGTYDGGGAQGPIKLALFASQQGEIVSGWLAFNVGCQTLYVPFSGDYRCKAGDCKLNAKCTESIPPEVQDPYFRSGDLIALSGKDGQGLQGALQAASREVFKEGRQNVSYSLKFSVQ